MKRNVLIFGTISGLIPILWFFIAQATFSQEMEMESGMWYGYASMIIGNIFLVVGVKNYRDKYNNGYITFWKALGVGAMIALIAATIYVVCWLIYFYTSGTDFIEYYQKAIHDQLVASGASAQEIARNDAEMKEFAIMYQNPLVNAMFTYMEILPVSLLFTVITAIVMRKVDKRPQVDVLDSKAN